jgi:hypothetical protein
MIFTEHYRIYAQYLQRPCELLVAYPTASLRCLAIDLLILQPRPAISRLHGGELVILPWPVIQSTRVWKNCLMPKIHLMGSRPYFWNGWRSWRRSWGSVVITPALGAISAEDLIIRRAIGEPLIVCSLLFFSGQTLIPWCPDALASHCTLLQSLLPNAPAYGITEVRNMDSYLIDDEPHTPRSQQHLSFVTRHAASAFHGLVMANMRAIIQMTSLHWCSHYQRTTRKCRMALILLYWHKIFWIENKNTQYLPILSINFYERVQYPFTFRLPLSHKTAVIGEQSDNII